ncbi:hypothetical protein [Parasitella parasitica]|uniref:Uncharacterized protein n=1 Tax=Parasitella parasitica TaxID=35722 RepID=A0A0B7NJA3_9FUNG|nr:hypothetical protein [Parasitella parasitica]
MQHVLSVESVNSPPVRIERGHGHRGRRRHRHYRHRRRVAGMGPTPKVVSSKGGRGGFGIPPPAHYAHTRAIYSNYAPVYAGGYNSTSRYGYVGEFNPNSIYFWIIPPFKYYSYDLLYHRYQQDNGYYYAPQLTEQGNNSSNVVINGTVNSGNNDNYHYSFNISTNKQYPMADHAFFSTSDYNAHNANFAYRLQFSHLIEFDDTNQNGFYDPDEQVYSVTSLKNLEWQTFQVQNINVANNETQFYFQTSTMTNVIYNNTCCNTTVNDNFTIRITYRTSNSQLNNTAPIVIEPNSLQYDFNVEGFPTVVANARPNARLGLTQLVSSMAHTPIRFDVNTTTPLDVAQHVKTNATYGLSIGDYTQGRSEYQSNVNISDVSFSPPAGINATAVAADVTHSPDDWIWGANTPSSRERSLLLITFPDYITDSNIIGTMNMSFSGFAFLDTDIMNALASDGGLSSFGFYPDEIYKTAAFKNTAGLYHKWGKK